MNWEQFVKSIIESHDSGKSSEELSEEFGGKEYFWNGKISEIKIDEEFAPSIVMVMVMEKINLKTNDGHHIDTRHLSLQVDDDTKETWRSSSVGETVDFSTNIKKANAVFPGVELSLFDDDEGKSGYISISTKSSKRMS